MTSCGVKTDTKTWSTCNGQSVIEKPAVAQNLLLLQKLWAVFLIHLDSVFEGVNAKMRAGGSPQKDRKSVFSGRAGCVEGRAYRPDPDSLPHTVPCPLQPSPIPTHNTENRPPPWPLSDQYNWIAGLVEGSTGSPLHLVDKCDLFFPTLGYAYRFTFLSQRHLEILH